MYKYYMYMVVGENWKLSRFNHIISHARATQCAGDVNFLYRVPGDGAASVQVPIRSTTAVMRGSEKNSSQGTRTSNIYIIIIRVSI